MRARGWVLVGVAVLAVLGLGLSAVAAKPAVSAVGSASFFIPPILVPPVAPNGFDVHLVFSVRGYDDGSSAGNATMRLFDGASGKLTAVLTAVRQPWLDGGRAWGVQWSDPWIWFWTQFELKEGAVHWMLLRPWTWWVHDDGRIDEICFHSMGPFEVLKGNVTVHLF
jgi:hypothetical protein